MFLHVYVSRPGLTLEESDYSYSFIGNVVEVGRHAFLGTGKNQRPVCTTPLDLNYFETTPGQWTCEPLYNLHFSGNDVTLKPPVDVDPPGGFDVSGGAVSVRNLRRANVSGKYVESEGIWHSFALTTPSPPIHGDE